MRRKRHERRTKTAAIVRQMDMIVITDIISLFYPSFIIFVTTSRMQVTIVVSVTLIIDFIPSLLDVLALVRQTRRGHETKWTQEDRVSSHSLFV
jgi:hypothetical protein